VAVAPAGPYANHLHLAPDNTSPLSFLIGRTADALPATQPTASKHLRQQLGRFTAYVCCVKVSILFCASL